MWRWLASHFDARRLVFVDESGFHTSMTRLRARAPKGERAYGKVPRNRGKNETLIASITFEAAMGASMTVEGATDAAAFEAYVEHFLGPTLEKGQVVVLDGLGAHRTDKVRELIEERGAELLFLPSYSPDLNPIEEAFSKIKNISQEGPGTHTRSVSRSHSPSDLGAHARRRGGMVRPLRLLPTGSILMNTAVRSRYQKRRLEPQVMPVSQAGSLGLEMNRWVLDGDLL